jgi:hypothetical protein
MSDYKSKYNNITLSFEPDPTDKNTVIRINGVESDEFILDQHPVNNFFKKLWWRIQKAFFILTIGKFVYQTTWYPKDEGELANITCKIIKIQENKNEFNRN